MINPFQVAPQDQSMFYLGKIFGDVSSLLTGGSAGSGYKIVLLGAMFKTFNTVLLTVCILAVFYITIVGVLATAHEGEVLGKRWHSLWVPIRVVLGIAALIPTATGYSGIQIIIMWIIVQGIGAADQLWNAALSFVQVAGSPYAQISVPGGGSVNQTMQTLFKSLTCQATAKATYDNPSRLADGGYYCKDNPGETFCRSPLPVFDPNQSTYKMGPGGICGTLTYCDQNKACADDPTKLNCVACKAQITALSQLIPVLSNIASQLVNTDYQYRLFYYTSYDLIHGTVPPWVQSYCSANHISACCVPLVFPFAIPGICQGSRGDFYDVNIESGLQNPSNDAVQKMYWPYNFNTSSLKNFVGVNSEEYATLLTNAITDTISHMAQDPSKWKSRLAEASKNGWIFAGAYYHYLAQMNNNDLQSSEQPFTIDSSDPGISPSSRLYHYRSNYQAADALITASMQNGADSQSGGSHGDKNKFPEIKPSSSSFSGKEGAVANKLSSELGHTNSFIMKIFMNMLTGSNNGYATNPLLSLQSTGEQLLHAVEGLFVASIEIAAASVLLGSLSVFGFGTGFVNPLGPMFSMVIIFLEPLVLGFIAAFLVLGGLLSVYLPLVPYIIFTTGAIGWFMSTIEAMVAAPLVALGILAPGGHHEILGKAEPALTLIFAIFLRPSLMIFGLVAAILLAGVIVALINASFLAVMGDISQTSFIVEMIFFMSAYVFLIIASLNKCFALIHIIPERVMRWVSGQGDQYGESEALGEVKGGMQGAGGQTISGASSPSKSTKQAGQEHRDFKDKQKKMRQEEEASISSTKDEGEGDKK